MNDFADRLRALAEQEVAAKMPEPLHFDVHLQDHAVTLRFADTTGLVSFIKWLDAAELKR